jgi:hypothetical protein
VNGEAIKLVTLALRNRLKKALDLSQVPGTVFVGPLDDQNAAKAKLILFLYKIVPNASLRNREHTVVTSSSVPQVYRNALPLDLYFLVTVGDMPNGKEETLLKALGFVMQELQADPFLTGADVEHQTVQVSLEPLSTDEASRIWNLFPTANYRTSIAYLATPIWIDPLQPTSTAEPVLVDRLRAGAVEIGGVA